jgi:hypothetical protein
MPLKRRVQVSDAGGASDAVEAAVPVAAPVMGTSWELFFKTGGFAWHPLIVD